ncbi:hypothetical protein I2F17_00230 [Acinetobacter sp. B10A]|nr:hypothetical protein [Acinetobacter baretiae]
MHSKKDWVKGLIGVVSMVLVSHASAEAKLTKEPVSVELKTYLMSTGNDGKQTAKLVTNVKPNDVVEYRATYMNNTSGDIKNLVATLPLPVETHFLAKAQPENATASIDGINFSPMPLKRKEGEQVVNVSLKDYRALRWTIAVLPAGKSITVSAQTRVNTEKPQAK